MNSSRNNKKGFQEKGTIRTLVKFVGLLFYWQLVKIEKKETVVKLLYFTAGLLRYRVAQKRKKKKDQTRIRDRKSEISDIRGKTDVKKLCVFSGNSHFRPGLAQTGKA